MPLQPETKSRAIRRLVGQFLFMAGGGVTSVFLGRQIEQSSRGSAHTHWAFIVGGYVICAIGLWLFICNRRKRQ